MITIIHNKERSAVVRRVSVDFTSISTASASASSPSPNSSLKLKKEQQTFPFKLFEMIKYANDSGCSSSLLSWSPDGKTFYIHDKDAMMNDLAPRFFNQTKFRSFTRQLNIWSFKRIGSNGWQHKNFIRERPDLLEHIVRTEIKNAAAVKRNMSTSSYSASVLGGNNVSSQSTTGATQSRRKRAKTEKVAIAVADENSSFSSPRVAGVDSALVSYEDDAHLHNLQHYVYVGTAAAAEPAATTATQAQVISTTQGQKTVIDEYVTAAEVVQSSTGTSACLVDEVVIEAQPQPQPFSDDESMYLADLFGKYERERPSSHEDDLYSILSLNRETTLEDFLLDL